MKQIEDIQILPDLSKEDSMAILYQARTAYDDRRLFLKKRRRSSDFHLGRQWKDTMVDPDTGQVTTEEEYIRKQRRIPAQNNQINTIVRNMVGRFRNNYPDPIVFGINRDMAQAGDVMTSALQRALDVNQAAELDAREMEEFTLSAGFGWKSTYGWWPELNRKDVEITEIDQTRFFFNADGTDIRGKDVWLCGEILDLRIDEVISKFAKNKKDAKRIAEMFPTPYDQEGQIRQIPSYMKRYKSFYYPDNADKVRVIEVWREEYEWLSFVHDRKRGKYWIATPELFTDKLGFSEEDVEKFNEEELVDIWNQMEMETAYNSGVSDMKEVAQLQLKNDYAKVWYCYMLTPLGDALLRMKTPYEHGSNPYDFGYYPMIDGETYSLVESVIDQQKHINRLISLLDASLAKSVKNLMFVPKTIVPDEFQGDYQAFADQAMEYNGMVFYTPKGNVQMPQNISQNSMPVGAHELLQLQMNLINDISAINDAVKGEDPGRQTTASMYAQRTANAGTTNKDYFEFFLSVMRKRNRKIVSLIKQYYDEPRYIRIAGSGFNKGISDLYEPELVKDIDFDVIVGEMEDTLAYRQTIDDYLSRFLEGQLISLEEFLENTSLPFADKLLETIHKRQQQEPQQPGQEGTADPEANPNALPPEVLQLLQQQN